MITVKKAEALAGKAVQDFVNGCECESPEDAGNALLLLAHMVGRALASGLNKETAVAMMEGVASHMAGERSQ